MNKMVVFAAGLILTSFLTGHAFAQETERDLNEARRGAAYEKETSRAAGKARQRSLPELERVSFEAVLDHPDDVALNVQFAKAQVAQGDVLGAAATLQRILLVDASLDQVRLFYAAVLLRLDNLTEARRELDILSKRELSGPMRAELKRFQKQIEKRKRRTHLNLRESVGWGYDTNRNAAPSSKQRLFGNVLLPVSRRDGAHRDTSFLNITSIDVSHDLGFQAGHELLGSFTYFQQEQTRVNSLDLQSLQYALGGTYKSKWANVTPLFSADHVFLSSESFLRSQGGSVHVDRDFFRGRLNVYNRNTLAYQDFLNISENAVADQRSGTQYELKQGAVVNLIPTMQIGTALGFVHKEAKADFNAYDRINLDVDHTWIWPKGQFIINSLTASFDEYDEPDVALAGRERHDRTMRYRLTYGTPLGTMFFFARKFLPDPIKDVTATFTYEYYRALSNYTNYTYHNNKIQVMLTKKWGF